jgi:Zn-dependent M28 family amino/carboxypeptidase
VASDLRQPGVDRVRRARSDYDAFISVGIPAGGLFTGAEGIKTDEEAAIYGGGTTGVAYDPCYHEACDTVANNSPTGLDQMSDAIAHATLTYAMTTSAVNGTAKASSSAVGYDPVFKGHLATR